VLLRTDLPLLPGTATAEEIRRYAIAPKFLRGKWQIRLTEVEREPDAKNVCEAEGDIGIAGEIEIDLETEQLD
jgi:hypothetical protein